MSEKPLTDAMDLRKKYNDRVPVICIGSKQFKSKLDNKQYLVPRSLTLLDFLYTLRKTLKLKQSDSLIILINNELPLLNQTFDQLDQKYKKEDGIVYITCTQESVFG